MTKQIWKYPILDTIYDIEMPKTGEILCMQLQDGQPTIWVLVDPKEKKETRTFQIIPTGHDIDFKEEKKYIGTFQTIKRMLVFHLFEILKQQP